jgi:CelD/BcsL family acetyltransferase involved in cellulose biosynthesis
MSTIAATLPHERETPKPADGRAGFRVDIVDGVREAESAWRELAPDAIMSPYQRFDWIKAFADIPEVGRQTRTAIVRDGSGRVVLVMPLAVTRQLGVRIARPIGGKHANFNLPVWRRGALGHDSAELLRLVGRAMQVDALVFTNAPPTWDGEPNPFATGGRPSPSNAYRLSLQRDPDATLASALKGEARKKLRNLDGALARKGSVTFLKAAQKEEVETILAAFFRHKEERFGDLGIDDPFAAPEVRDCLRRASLDGLETGHPAIELYGLALDGKILSTFGAVGDTKRLSGMFLSFAPSEENARFSPGRLLVLRVIRDQCERGRDVFDLGVGEASYKRSFCPETEDLVDATFPVTSLGAMAAAAGAVATDLKRVLKSNEHAMKLVATLRRLRAGKSPAGAA